MHGRPTRLGLAQIFLRVRISDPDIRYDGNKASLDRHFQPYLPILLLFDLDVDDELDAGLDVE